MCEWYSNLCDSQQAANSLVRCQFLYITLARAENYLVRYRVSRKWHFDILLYEVLVPVTFQ